MEEAQKQLEEEGDEETVLFLVHLGVHARASGFLLEQVACNEMTFSSPDMRGLLAVQQPICSNSPFQNELSCGANLQSLAEKLLQEGFPVEVSSDAGRFICNYIYYQSLSMCQNMDAPAPVYSLFVHVPAEATVPLESQERFVLALLHHLHSVECEKK